MWWKGCWQMRLPGVTSRRRLAIGLVAVLGIAGEGIWGMASAQDTLWLACRIGPGDDRAASLDGFCSHLAAEITRLTGRAVRLVETAPLGATVLGVQVDVVKPNLANVVLRVGVQAAAGVEPGAAQELQIRVTDAGLRSSSAAGLVYPLMNLLDSE